MLICTVPKLTLEGLAVSDPPVTPVPDNETESEGFEALLAMLRLPLAAPLVCGAKATVKLVL